MKGLVSEETILELLIEYISFYTEITPENDELKKFVKFMCEEKNILIIYKKGMITLDELCFLLLNYIFSKFVPLINSDFDKDNEFHEKLKSQILEYIENNENI